MEMLVRILGLGSEWWVRPGPDRSDPLRFTKHAAYFNTTAFPYGSKFRRSWKVPGVLRFNGTSRIDPHRPNEVLGSIYGCVGQHNGQNRLLAIGKRYGPLIFSSLSIASCTAISISPRVGKTTES